MNTIWILTDIMQFYDNDTPVVFPIFHFPIVTFPINVLDVPEDIIYYPRNLISLYQYRIKYHLVWVRG